MSSKSAVKLVVPEGDECALYQLGRDPDGLEERAEGRRLLPRRPAAYAGRIPDRRADPGGHGRNRAGQRLHPDARPAARPPGRQGEVQAHVLQQPGGQHPRGGPHLPVRLSRRLVRRRSPCLPLRVVGWNFWQVGGYLAVWVIGYGIVQASAPRFVRRRAEEGGEPDGRTAAWLAFALATLPGRHRRSRSPPTPIRPPSVVVGLIIFGVLFAMNSAVHSYLILSYADNDKVAMNVGFYYMANAIGRFAGTILSGLLYEWHGLTACLWVSAAFVVPRRAALAAPANRGRASARPPELSAASQVRRQSVNVLVRAGSMHRQSTVAPRRSSQSRRHASIRGRRHPPAVDAGPLPASVDCAGDGRRAGARVARARASTISWTSWRSGP